MESLDFKLRITHSSSRGYFSYTIFCLRSFPRKAEAPTLVATVNHLQQPAGFSMDEDCERFENASAKKILQINKIDTSCG
jgi:hypothetical protein